MWFPTILLSLILLHSATAGDSALPDHYDDLEQYLLSRMDFSADPCNDFHTYACGNSDDYMSIMAKENHRILKAALDKLFPSLGYYSESSAFHKALRLYSACVYENITKAEADVYTKKSVNTFMKQFNFPVDFFFNDKANVNINREKFSEVLKYVHDNFFIEPFFSIIGVQSKITPKKNPKSLAAWLFGNVKKTFLMDYECGSPKLFEKFVEGVRNVTITMGLTATQGVIAQTARELMEFELRLSGIPCGNNKSTVMPTSAENWLEIESLTFENYNIDLNNYVRSLIDSSVGNYEVDIMFQFENLREVLQSTSDADLLRYIYFRIIMQNAVEIDCPNTLTPMALVKSRIFTEFKHKSKDDFKNFSDELTFEYVIEQVKITMLNMVISVPWIIDGDIRASNVLARKFYYLRSAVAIEEKLWDNAYLDKYYNEIQFYIYDRFFDMFSTAQQFAMYEKTRLIVHDPTDVESDLTLVNANFNPRINKLMINDGFLNAPIYNKKYDPSFNLGSLAGVIGHEMGHSVDTQGINFDENGFNAPFFMNSTNMEFEKMTKCVVDQYNNIQVLPSNYTINRVNGQQTVSENMADISGFQAAYSAFYILKKHGLVGKHPQFKHPKLRGLTPNQLFFLGMANPFCYKQDYDTVHYLIKNDVHTPNRARALSFSNIRGFGKAFNCPLGSKYYPTEICRVWLRAPE